MTENEAKNSLMHIYNKNSRKISEDFNGIEAIDAFDMAIKALEEIQKYRAIGTVKECRAAMEKQKSKKPVTYRETNRADCPICGNTVRGIKKPFGTYCCGCGQKLDWSDEE